MADKTLKVTLSAKDDASAAFKKLGDSAKTLGDELNKTGDEFSDFGDESEKATVSLKDIDRVGKDVALSIGIVGAALVLASKSFRDNDIALQTLERSYGDASDSMRDFTQQIQDTTNYSNDQALESANIAATLARNYGFSADEIQRVLTISADLAATSGLSLADSTQRVTAALRGEAEGAEVLGLTMNQAAIDSQNLTLSMSNQEAGHYRLNALIEQSAFAQGAAAQQADTFYGSLTQVKDTVQDMGQGLAGALGPMADLGAFAADNAVSIAAMGLAAGQFAKTAQGLSQTLTGVGVAANGLSLVTAAMTGPLGIVIAATAAGLAIKAFAGTIGPSFHEASGDAVASIDAVIEKIVELGDTSALAQTVLGLDTISASYQQVNDEANNAIGAIGAWISEAAAMDDANADTVEGLMLSSAEFDNLTQHQREVIDANSDGIATLTELTNAQAAFNDEAINSQRILDGLSGGADELSQIFTMTGEGAAEAKAAANEYTQALLDGKLSSKDYELGLQGLIQRYGEIREDALASGSAIDDNTASVNNNATALTSWMDAGGDIHTLTDDIATSMQDMGEASAAMGVALMASTDPFVIRQSKILAGMQAQMTAMGAMSTKLAGPSSTQDYQAADSGIAGAIAGANAYQSAQEGLARGIANASDAMTYQVGESQRLADELDKLAKDKAEAVAAATVAMTSAFDAVTTAVTGTTKALDSGFQVVVGNTNAIAQASQGVADWADELIGASGTYATMDDLLQRGVITMGDYTAAQEAYGPIAEANARIQDDVLAIQTRQAPVLAELAEQQANYMDSVANMTPEMQTYTLAMMDSATSAEALQLATALLGENGDTFAPMVESAANLDPYLASILVKMGLIEQQPDGTYTVTADTAGAQSQIDALIASNERLIASEWILKYGGDATAAEAAYEDATGLLVDWDNSEGTADLDADGAPAQGVLDHMSELLGQWDSSSGSADANVNDNASGTLATIASWLSQLDGRSVTTYINTVSTFSGSSISPLGYAHGGVIAELGEAGPEMLHFANGGMSPVYEHGYYPIPTGTYVSPNNATGNSPGGQNVTINVTVQGSMLHTEDFKEQLTGEIADAWVRGMRTQERGVGW